MTDHEGPPLTAESLDNELAHKVKVLRQASASEEDIQETIHAWRKNHAPAGEPDPGCRDEDGNDTQSAATGGQAGAGESAGDEQSAKGSRGEGAPRDNDAEMSTLGAMLENSNAVTAVSDRLVPTDFYLAKHQKIYGAMIALDAKGEPVDVRTVKNELTQRHQLEEVGGRDYLDTLVRTTPDATRVLHYADIVRDVSICGQVGGLARDRCAGHRAARRRRHACGQGQCQVFAIAQGRRSTTGSTWPMPSEH